MHNRLNGIEYTLLSGPSTHGVRVGASREHNSRPLVRDTRHGGGNDDNNNIIVVFTLMTHPDHGRR